MRLIALRVIIATFVLSVARPAKVNWKSNGTAIPLTKRPSLLRLDNSINFEALDLHIELVNAKMFRGFENYERNTGMPHPLSNKETKPPEVENRKVGAVSAASLTGYNNLLWYATISIGTPPMSFTVDIDTGSSDLFVPGLTCLGCQGDNRWDPTLSTTADNKDSTFSLKFQDEATVSGAQYTDNVTIAGLTADIQTIGVASTYTNVNFPPDGILGMAFQSISAYPASPLFETLVNERKVPDAVFSIKLTPHGGELYLGGTNDALYKNDISYTDVTVVGCWQVNIAQIRGDRRIILRDVNAIIDTGANVIIGDRSQVSALHRALGGTRIGRGFYSFPCNNFPTISLSFGGRTFRIPAELLNQGEISRGSPLCFSGIVGRGPTGRNWSLGAVFLRGFYTVFDYGQKRVGFADLKRT